MSRFCPGLAVLVVLAYAATASAGINVNDGTLSDWGVTLDGDNRLTYTGASYDANVTYSVADPDSAVGRGTWDNYWDDSTLFYLAEDTGRTGAVGPNSGGQNYDTEYLGALVHGGNLYIGISTGQRPDNGFSNYSPGDIRLAIGPSGADATSIYGVEVGGGPGGSLPASGEIVGGDNGTTYSLNGNGYTTGSTTLTGEQLAGSIWQTPASGGEWYMDPIAPPLPTQLTPIAANSPVAQLASDEFVYTFPDDPDGDPSQHAFIEMVIDLDDIGLGFITGPTTINVAWRPSCGNDDSWTDVDVDMPPPPPVPEPASVAVWGLLVLAFGGCASWRRRGKNAR